MYLKTLFLLTLGIISTLSAAPKSTWSEKMLEMSTILPELMIDVAKEGSLNNKQIRERVKTNTKKLARLSHKIANDKKTGLFDRDPSLEFLSIIFEDQVTHAQSALEKGHYEYARGLLVSVSSYCISCHTRDDEGVKHPAMKFNINEEKLSSAEKADLYAATRQFERALTEYEIVVADANMMNSEPFEWQKAVHKMLAISVRVKNDPERAIKALKKIPIKTYKTSFLTTRVSEWIDSLEAWKREPKAKKNPKDPLAESKRLISKARATQEYPADESGMIYYLRASAELHDVLRSKLTAQQMAEAFFLTGICYETIDVLKLWSLPEIYYQSCIYRLPHSSLAEKCFHRFEENIYAGYTGTSGTHLPTDVKKKLLKLSTQAKRTKG